MKVKIKKKTHSRYNKHRRFTRKTHKNTKDEILDYDDLLRRGLITEEEDDSNIYMFSNDDYDIRPKIPSRHNLKIKINTKSGTFNLAPKESEEKKTSNDNNVDSIHHQPKNLHNNEEKNNHTRNETTIKSIQNELDIKKGHTKTNEEIQKTKGDKSLNFNNPEKINNSVLINQQLASSLITVPPPFTQNFNQQSKMSSNMDMYNNILYMLNAYKNPIMPVSGSSFRENRNYKIYDSFNF